MTLWPTSLPLGDGKSLPLDFEAFDAAAGADGADCAVHSSSDSSRACASVLQHALRQPTRSHRARFMPQRRWLELSLPVVVFLDGWLCREILVLTVAAVVVHLYFVKKEASLLGLLPEAMSQTCGCHDHSKAKRRARTLSQRGNHHLKAWMPSRMNRVSPGRSSDSRRRNHSPITADYNPLSFQVSFFITRRNRRPQH